MNEDHSGADNQVDTSTTSPSSADKQASADVDPHQNTTNRQADASGASASTVSSSRRGFLKGLASLSTGLIAAGLSASEHTPAAASVTNGTPGAAKPWQASIEIYSGHTGLSNGNTLLTLPVCGWSGLGRGVQFTLVFNSQSMRAGSLGNKWTHSYNMYLTGSNPVVFVDGDGSEYAYTPLNNSYTPPAGCYDTLTHNTDGTWTLAKKGGSKYAFSSGGALASVVDNNGLTTTLTYTNGLLTTVTDAAGRQLTLGYSSAQIASVTDCQNKTYTLSYVNNLPVSLATPPLAGQTYTQQISYDANGNVATLSDRLGRTWGYTYSGNILSGTLLPGGASAGSSGGSRAMAQQQNNTIRGGGTSAISTAPGTVWPANVVTSNNWQDATSNNTQYGLDNLGRLVAVVDAVGNQTVHTYDNSHNRTATQLPSGNTWHSTFDTYGNNLVAQDPIGNQTTYAYDGPSGRLLSVTDANNNATSYGYDNKGNRTSVQDGNGNIATTSVNNLGQIISRTNPVGQQWLYNYDANGFLMHTADPQGHITQLAYNSVGQIMQRTDALIRVTNYASDSWGRITGVAYPTTGNPTLGYSYDAAGQLTQTSDGTGIRTYQYNTLGQRTAMTDPRGSTSATYDNLSRLLAQTDVSGRQTSNTYTALDQIASVKDGNDNATVTCTYTVDGQASTITYPNDTQTTYGYDNAGRICRLTHARISTGSVIVDYAAQYDSGGRLTKVTEQPSGDVTIYSYDNAGNQLSEVRTGSKPYSATYTYDQSNSRVTAKTITNGIVTHNGAYSYDAAGRLSQVVDNVTTPPNTEAYTWNPDGTLASYSGPADSGYTRRLRYDEEQRLTGIAHDYGNGNVTLTYEYGYAADGGKRWEKNYTAGVWTWYPCGVACNAGELVEQTSDLTGSAWTTSGLYMKIGSACSASIVRRNGEYHHFDVVGRLAVVTGSNATALASRVYNNFGVQQYTSGSAQTPWTAVDNKVGAETLSTRQDCVKVGARATSLTDSCGAAGALPNCETLRGTTEGKAAALKPCQGSDTCSHTAGPTPATGCKGGNGTHDTYKCGKKGKKQDRTVTIICCPCVDNGGYEDSKCYCQG